MPRENVTIAAAGIGFTGTATFVWTDGPANEFTERLVARIGVDVSTPGVYTIFGLLTKNGKVVANRPPLESSQPTSAIVVEPGGFHTVPLEFSCEQILRSGEDGPYELKLVAVGGRSPAMEHLAAPPLDLDRCRTLP